jgi:DNA topoisomerase-3
MTIGILTEKPSAARNFAAALGAREGIYQGESYVIVHARGHLYGFVEPHEMVSAAKRGQYKTWDLGSLPWDPSDLSWKRTMKKGVADMIVTLRIALRKVDEIAIATDIDPTGEGDLLAWEIIDELGLHGKKFSRMEFTDETPASIRASFVNRRPVTSMHDEASFRKAHARNIMDFLTIQHTRIATVASSQKAVLRQGRLKSAMVKLVGDQLASRESYVKTSQFQNRFRDENGVLYTDVDEPLYGSEKQVPRIYSGSTVVLDNRSDKRVVPRPLLDLAALSSRLSGRGVKAGQVLAVYQRMYEDQVVSYPRTEDKTITTEQFNELLPLADRIAGVVGVGTALLTHRAPRKTHVRDTGAHGANRPGPRVPASLDELTDTYGLVARYIYEELARSYLAMLAGDYVYEAQEGHVESHPSFKGRASVPKELGWKQVFVDTDDENEDEEDSEETAAGLGSRAAPIVYEVVPPRPEQPTMKWLMKQLEKRQVGTGATRTSIYADVTDARARFPLLHERRGKIIMTDFGQMSHRLLSGTRIGDLSATEQFYTLMDRIAAGDATLDDAKALVTGWVRHDIGVMQRNAEAMRSELGLAEVKQQKEKFKGVWSKTDETVVFSREWGGHRFTDEECRTLLAGEEVAFSATSATGEPFDVYGVLGRLYSNGKAYVGFKKLGFGKKGADGRPLPPQQWCGHTFTAAEFQALKEGRTVDADDFVSKRTKKTYPTTVRFGRAKDGQYKIIPAFSSEF